MTCLHWHVRIAVFQRLHPAPDRSHRFVVAAVSVLISSFVVGDAGLLRFAGVGLGFIAYNVVAVALAMTGWITPLIAAALMPTSSITVLGSTLATPRQTKSTR